MLSLLRAKFPEVAWAAAPLLGVVCVLQLVLVRAPAAQFLQFLAGVVLAVVGMMLLFSGIDLGVLPMGRFIGAELPKRGSLPLMLSVAFALGFATTVAEPDVLVLADQVQATSPGTIRSSALVGFIAVGVGLSTVLAMLRVVRGFSMTRLLTVVFALMILLAIVAPPTFVPLAFDAGSVTTGVLTTPVILALALGVTSVMARRSAVSDGFGLLGLASTGPVIVILLLGLLMGAGQ